MTEPASSDATLLFVYGTLRRDARPLPMSPLCRDWIFRGYGSVPGELYDFGAYPGAIPRVGGEAAADGEGTLAPRVRGELYELPNAAGVLPAIDYYEGCGPGHRPPFEFERERVTVELERDDVERDVGGEAVEAWIYWYRLEPEGRRLDSGDYAERTGSG